MHRLPKRWYKRTAKRNCRRGVLKFERKVVRMREPRKRMDARARTKPSQEVEEQKKAAQLPDVHHYIGRSQRTPICLSSIQKSIQEANTLADLGSGSVETDPLGEVRVHT
jgi:hypothetical protein